MFKLTPPRGLVIEVLGARPQSDALDRFRTDDATWHPTQLIAQGFDPALRSYRRLFTTVPSAGLVPGQSVLLSATPRP